MFREEQADLSLSKSVKKSKLRWYDKIEMAPFNEQCRETEDEDAEKRDTQR